MANALVVDDSKATRMILARVLKELGYSVREAGDGREALQALSNSDQVPELIVTDWNMPVMNGLEFVQQLRKLDRFAASTVVMVTTRTETDQVVAALDAGANEYVMKPFTKDMLEHKLRLLNRIPDHPSRPV